MDDFDASAAVEEMESQLRANLVDYDPSSELASFYANRCVLITGATGFVGKAMAEKLVRTCRDIKRVYVLIRDKRNVCVKDRLTELLQAQVFNRIRSQPGGDELLAEKVYAIKGDITLPNFGIAPEDMQLLSRDVSIVFNSAASVRFVEPLDVAVRNNIYSVSQLMVVTKQLEKLEAVVHVSTAYSNCNRRDTIREVFYEAPVSGDKILQTVERLRELQETLDSFHVTDGNFDSKSTNEDTFCQSVERLAQKLVAKVSAHKQPEPMEVYTERALERAHRPNVYTFTKAIAESYLLELARREPERYLFDKIPVCVVRPSIICGAWREPEVGFVDSYSGPTKANLDMGLGTLHAVAGTSSKRSDLVPIDMVANMILSVGWFLAREGDSGRHSSRQQQQQQPDESSAVKMNQGGYVFNMVTGYRNPTTWGSVTDAVHRCAYKFPSKYLVRLPTGRLVTAGIIYKLYDLFMQTIPAHILDLVQVYLEGKELSKRTSLVYNHKRNLQMLETLVPFVSNQWLFCDDNTHALYRRLSPIDKQLFPFDVTKINWPRYLDNFVMGSRIYLLKDEPLDRGSLGVGRRKLRRRQRVYHATLFVLFLVFYYFCLSQTPIESALLSLVMP